MADIYRITNFVSASDLFAKMIQAAKDVGFNTTSETSFSVNLSGNGKDDRYQITLDQNGYLHHLILAHGDSSYWQVGRWDTAKTNLSNGISEVHMIGWEDPKTILYAFRRTDEVWCYVFMGSLENTGGNGEVNIVSHSNQYLDGEKVGYYNRPVSDFPVIDEFRATYSQHPLFCGGHYMDNYRETWGSLLNFSRGAQVNDTHHWRQCGTGRYSEQVILGTVFSSWHYDWGTNFGWNKIQAINPDYDFPAQLLPIDIWWKFSGAYFLPLGNVAHLRVTKRSGMNALDRITHGNETYIMFPWSRAGVRTDGIGSGDYLYALKLSNDQLNPVSV